MRVLDVFSGIGGFSLGLERAGMRTVAFCEIEPYCRAVLTKHWPGVPILGDIRAVVPEQIAALEPIDVICGGFPCQDISVAGKGAGLAGERSGLWTEYARLVRLVRPRYVIVENVTGLLSRGLEQVLGDLATIGYDAQWHCIPASHVGAPHRRDRIWIVAYPNSNSRYEGRADNTQEGARGRHVDRSCICADLGYTHRERQLQSGGTECQERRRLGHSSWWTSEPNVGRMAHGVPARVYRLTALGNSIVPQIAELIGRAILRVEAQLCGLSVPSTSGKGASCADHRTATALDP